MIKVLIRHFAGRTPDGMEHGMALTATANTPSEALTDADRLGIMALEAKFPGIQDAAPVGEWTEYDMSDPEES